MEYFIKISNDFSRTPGARYRSDGKYSGEEFYEKKLQPSFKEALSNNAKLKIDLDGTYGYATSFLSEAFYSLGVEFGAANAWENIILISKEEPYLVEEIKGYIFDAESKS